MKTNDKPAAGHTPRYSIRAATLAIACAVMTGCGGGGDLAVMSASQANTEIAPGYFIDAGDHLKVTVFDEDTLSGDYEVGIGGTLALPLIDALVVKDQTPSQVSKLIEKKLEDGGYVLFPKVSIEIMEHRSFFILGEVATPGEYPHNGELTLEQAVAKAGGFTPRADKNAIVLKRQLWSQSKLVRLDQTALKVAPGDTITVRESFF